MNTKTKIIDTLDAFERKYIKWDFIYMVLSVVAIIWIFHTVTREVEVIDTVQAKEVKEVVETQKVVKNDNVPERAFNLITKYEWFHDKPYWDFKQWSCGYGMKCSKNTKNITKEKSKQFVMERIDSIRERYKLHDIADEIEVGLISFTYNIWHPPKWYRRYIDNWHIKALKYRMLEYSYAGGKFMRGLYKRRLDEWSFNN